MYYLRIYKKELPEKQGAGPRHPLQETIIELLKCHQRPEQFNHIKKKQDSTAWWHPQS